jgi:hypothetical protein
MILKSVKLLNEIIIERYRSIININVTTKRPGDTVCAKVYGYFWQNVPLGSNFISGQTYTININDGTITIIMQ